MVRRVRMILSGKVQGVFFRNFAKQNANKLGIVGYAKNIGDGKMEILAEGEERKIEEFVKLCKKGPMMAHVTSLDMTEETVVPDEHEYFDIRYM